jgi:hypothetical protein
MFGYNDYVNLREFKRKGYTKNIRLLIFNYKQTNAELLDLNKFIYSTNNPQLKSQLNYLTYSA